MASSTSSDNFLNPSLLREAAAAPVPTDAPPKPTKWQARWQAFRHPIQGEKNDLLKRRWESLPPELKLPNQISGQHLTHCGFTLGASYCSFHCTHCYLPKNANEVPIPSLAQMKEQIDANRRFQGPGGGLQITGGDVADAYWKSGRQDELVEVVRYATQTGLVPMVMTHGQTLLEHPEFLERLMVEGGLKQVSVHIDMTQAGRHGYPINRVKSEADLHPIREAFTQLALMLREKTGLPLEYAFSITVTERNIDFIPQIIQWTLEDAKRSHVWRMISFQPEADTGRTIFSKRPVTPALVWEKICEGTGHPLEKDATIFGHPDCNSWAPLLISRSTGRSYPLVPRDDDGFKKLLGDFLASVGGLSLVTDQHRTAPFRLAGVLTQNPVLGLRVAYHATRLVATGKIPWVFVQDLMRGEVHTLGVGMHNFMDAAMVANADNDPVVKARLDACVFKGAVKNETTGEYEEVPMCSMNQQRWADVYERRLQDPKLQAESQVYAATEAASKSADVAIPA